MSVSLDERESWGYATAVLASAALIVFFMGAFFSFRFFVPEFEIFVFYIPALLALLVFLMLRVRKTL